MMLQLPVQHNRAEFVIREVNWLGDCDPVIKKKMDGCLNFAVQMNLILLKILIHSKF